PQHTTRCPLLTNAVEKTILGYFRATSIVASRQCTADFFDNIRANRTCRDVLSLSRETTLSKPRSKSAVYEYTP
ncbi:MAG: hypothetical protein WBZ51_21910, partial [Xanthobacteraceae bacterium]